MMKYLFTAAVVLLLTNMACTQTCPSCCKCTVTTIQCVGVDETSDLNDVINRDDVAAYPNLNIFSDFPRLQTLDLSSNGIKRLSCNSNECSSLNTVEHLSLANNSLGPQFDVGSLRKQFANIASLNISYNNLEDLSAGVFPESLQHLDISHNPGVKAINFTSFGPASQLTTLIALYIHSLGTIELKEHLVKATPLTSFRAARPKHFGAGFEKCLKDGGCVFPSLTTLQVSESIVNSDWNSVLSLFPNLEYLDLSYNSVYHATMFRVHTAKLTHLNMRGNHIKVFNSVEWLQPNLRYLNLGSNNFTTINQIVHFRKLETLILDNNRIFSCKEGVFDKLDRLKMLDLRDNRLHSLRESQLPPSGNISVKLDGNSLSCRCGLMMKYYKGENTCLGIANCRLCFQDGQYRLLSQGLGLVDTCFLNEEVYETDEYDPRPEFISDTTSYVEVDDNEEQTTPTTTSTASTTTHELATKPSFPEVSRHWSPWSIVGLTLLLLCVALLICKLCYKFRDDIRDFWYRLF